MSRTEHDLRELLAKRSEGGSGGAAQLDAILARGRGIRRRRRWVTGAVAAGAIAVAAALTPVLLPGGGADSNIAAQVSTPREEGVRLAGARFESMGKVETLPFTPRSDRTSYRANCAGDAQVFVRFGDQVDHGRCGTNKEESGQNVTFGRFEGIGAGDAGRVEAFVVSTPQIPADITAESSLSSADFDRVISAAKPRGGLWEIAVHDGGVSDRSCSPDICLGSGTMFATKGERNLAGLSNSHQVEGRRLTKINKKVSVKAEVKDSGQVYVRCEDEGMYAFIWAGVGDGVLATAAPCGLKPVKWEFLSNGDGATVAVVRADQVPDDADFMRDPPTGAKMANELLKTLTPEPGTWDVSIQQQDEPNVRDLRGDKSTAPDGTVGLTYRG